MPPRAIKGERYATNAEWVGYIRDELPYLDFEETLRFYREVVPGAKKDDLALLGVNDRFFLLTVLLGRHDASHPWLFDRCREVEASPDGHLDLWAREHYKDLWVETPIPTPNGWTTQGALCAGDWVFGPDGEPTRVVAVTETFSDSECYEVEFDDGSTIMAGAGHLWAVERHTRKRVPGTHRQGAGKRQYRETVVMRTVDLAVHDHRQDNRLAIPVNSALDMPGALLPVEPYTLGCWLGDGTSADGSITFGDTEIGDGIRAEGYRIGAEIGGTIRRTVYGISPILRGLGLTKNKHIPVFYQRASVAQRLELLRGLMDTDGHCNTRGTATFVNKNERLVDDVYELATGLGLKPRKYQYDAAKGRYWQVAFQAYQGMNPFRIARKAARAKAGERPHPRRYIVAVRKVSTVPTRCIQVARPDGLYLAGRQMVTTHNSTIITFAGIIQEILADPEMTVGIFSHTKNVAEKFLAQIMRELESNRDLLWLYGDVLWDLPRVQTRWSVRDGIVLKRKSNPKEATVEAHGLVDGQPTGRHFGLMVYDDVVTRESVTNPGQVKKTTEAWELSDNLGAGNVRKWHIGTRYSFSDTYGVILERKILTPRIYPATDNGRMDGTPVFMDRKRWEEKKRTQRSTLAAQMLQNPLAGAENTFKAEWLRPWEVRPATLTVYIMADPSRGRSASSDRTAIAVVGLDAAGNKYLLDGYRHRMSLSERWQALKNLYLKWSNERGVQHVAVGYERYGQQSDDEYFQERMEREGFSFPLEELNWTRDGTQSKRERVERLEPDFRMGRFFLPAIVYEPGDGDCLWAIDVERGHVVTKTMRGPTRNMDIMKKSGREHLIARSIRRKDEDGKLYDVTRALMEEMLFFPFAPKDDLVDVTSRIYDMQAVPPAVYEDAQAAAGELYDYIDA